LINALTLNAIVDPNLTDQCNFLINMFNIYATENNIDITIRLTVMSPENTANDYATAMELLLNKKSLKYDLYFYDSVYSAKFGKHFTNLYEYLPREHINMYNSNIISNSCIYNSHLIGLIHMADQYLKLGMNY